MSPINNLKKIREIYGATQEQIARALSVNRVTVANWENGSSKASSANREKMSIYYGIGPEFFYEKDLSEEAKLLIRQTAEKERLVVEESDGHRSKQEDFREIFQTLSFDEIREEYMLFTKMLLAKADDADLETLCATLIINQKMGRRLEAIIRLRQEEETEDSLEIFPATATSCGKNTIYSVAEENDFLYME